MSALTCCSWCGTTYVDAQADCRNCGGPLPPPPGNDPGPPPPDPPRRLPSGFKKRTYLTRNVPAIVGTVFTLAGFGFSVGGAFASVIMMIVGLPFFIGGVVVLIFGLSRANKTVRSLALGRWAPGKISDVYYDTSVEFNGRSPWAIVYSYEVAAQEYSGTARTWDRSASERKAGQPIHVLYMSETPDISTIYPPVK